jgi:hypothetical protein
MSQGSHSLIGGRRLVCACCAGAAGGPGIAPAQSALPQAIAGSEPQIVPVEKTSFHIPVFSNDYATLLKVMIPPGHTSGYHTHSIDTASVVVAAANVTAQELGGVGVDRKAQVGRLNYSEYSQKPVTHVVTNIDTSPLQVVLFEITRSKEGLFSPSSRMGDYRMELDERVRGWRLVLDPGQCVPAITQQSPGARIVVDGGILAESTPNQPDRMMNLQRGDFFWQDANATRSLCNAGSSRIELVELELR